MRNKVNIPAILIAVAFLVSCQKDFIDDGATQTPVIVSNDTSHRLSQLIIMNGLNSANDPYCILGYTYDSLKRVLSISTDYLSVPILYSTVTYFYNGSDSIPYKKIKAYRDPIYIRDSSTAFYFYDNLNRLTRDSILFSYATEVDIYTYSDSMITAAKRHVENVITPDNPNFETDTAFIGATGDVIRTNSLTNSGSYSIISFTYDDKPNPLYLLNIHPTYSPLPGRDYNIADFYLQRNNVAFITQEYPGSPALTSTSKYNYNYYPSGLPSFADIVNHLGTKSDYGIRFVYK